MNSLTIQVAFAKRCFALASRSSVRQFTTSRFNLNEEKPVTAESTAESTAKPVAEQDASLIKGFFEKGIISEPVYAALNRMKFTNFTPVQTKTIEPISKIEKGIVARAKTGTGKTLAFGLPLIERALKRPDPRRNPDVIGLIISPTRDLAYQIRDELNKITNNFGRDQPRVNVLCLVGGESKHLQIRPLTRLNTTPQIIVATPGRLYDMLENPLLQDAIKNVEFKVLDEADRLLDDGFKANLLEIQSAIADIKAKANSPTEKTLLFSATIDRNVLNFAEDLMGKELLYIDTVDKNEPETHEKIEQSLIATENTFESFAAANLFIGTEAARNQTMKSVVFLPTVKSVSFYQRVLYHYVSSKNLRIPVYELHGKLSQAQRDRAVRQFRERSRGILVTSDVGARGMDFPGVTNVVQVGVPSDTTNYVHRIGRTARGGKSGNALMILSKSEIPFVKELTKRKINIANKFVYEKNQEVEDLVAESGASNNHKYSANETLESMIGFYNSVLSSYRMSLFDCLANLSSSYGQLVGQPGKLPRASRTILTKVLNINRKDASRYFDMSPQASFESSYSTFDGRNSRFGNDDGANDSDSGFSRFGNRGGNKGGYGGNRGSYGGNRGSYGGNRGGNRGGFSDRRGSGPRDF